MSCDFKIIHYNDFITLANQGMACGTDILISKANFSSVKFSRSCMVKNHKSGHGILNDILW